MIERIEPGKTMSRAVIHNGLIYFGGHVSGGKQPTMKVTKGITKHRSCGF